MSLLSEIAIAIKTKLGGTSINNTIPRYDGTSCTLKNSGVTISDTNVVTAGGGFVGNLTGTASNATLAASATKLATARTINGVAFDGTANILVPADRYVISKDQRALKPADLDSRAIGFYFSSLGGMTGTSNAVYGDLITLNSYSDSSGGNQNALFFRKNTMEILHYQSATYGAATWGTPKTLAYTNSDITGNAATATSLATARTINGVAFDGTANITIADSTKAPLASPALTGVPTAPTAAVGTNNTQIATTAFVQANKTAVTAATVATSIAGISAGAVGSYVFAHRSSTSSAINMGGTVSGSQLYAACITQYLDGSNGLVGAVSSTALTGTWRCMGYSYSGYHNNLGATSYTLWLRIA